MKNEYENHIESHRPHINAKSRKLDEKNQKKFNKNNGQSENDINISKSIIFF